MDKLKNATIACPSCGNINPYLEESCIKCGMPLEPIRVAMEKVKDLNNVSVQETQKPIESPRLSLNYHPDQNTQE